MADDELVPEGNAVIGPLTACALLRGEPKTALRHRLKDLRGTLWGKACDALAGSNGHGADRLIRALSGLRMPGLSEDETRRHFLASIGKFDGLVEQWLDADPVFEKRRKAPSRTADEVSGMFSATEWLWRPWLPRGYLSMIVGKPGAGKSYVALWLATNLLTLGGQFPDGEDSPGDPGEVMWIDTEGTHRLLLERLETLAAPRTRFRWPIDPANREEDFPIVNLAQERWVGIVADLAMAKRPAWIIVDSLRGAHNLDENSSDMQAMLGASAALARDLNCGFTFIHHLRKASAFERVGEVHLDQIRGSTAIAAMARVVLALDQPDPNKPAQRLRVIKSNLGPLPEPIGLEVRERGPIVCESAPAAPRAMTATDRAAEWLLAKLEAGPMPATELLEEGKANGISSRSLKRAVEALGIVVAKIEKHWEWSLPPRPGQEEPF